MHIDIDTFELLSKENKDLLKKRLNDAMSEKLKSKKFMKELIDECTEVLREDFYDYIDLERISKMFNKFVEDAVAEKIQKGK